MAVENDFKVFAGSGGANVITQAQFLALAALTNGFSSGLASSPQLNKVWRQSSIMASMIAQFIADETGLASLDDGTIATLETNFIAAIQNVTQIKATATVNLYVNVASGSDTNNGLSPSTPFKTMQAAFAKGYTEYNYNGNKLQVTLASGTYTQGLVLVGMPVGCSQVVLTSASGAGSTALNVSNAIALDIRTGTIMDISGLTITASGTAGAQGIGLQTFQSNVTVGNCTFGSCGSSQIAVTQSSTLATNGNPLTFTGSAPVAVTSTGCAVCFLTNSVLNFSSAAYSFSIYDVSNASVLNAIGTAYSGGATGVRYNATQNGVLLTNGGYNSIGNSSTAGVVSTGGQIS